MHTLPLHLIIEFAFLGSTYLLLFAIVCCLDGRKARKTEEQWLDRYTPMQKAQMNTDAAQQSVGDGPLTLITLEQGGHIRTLDIEP
jgi:hypothetical protein